jgi:hypothetical protein
MEKSRKNKKEESEEEEEIEEIEEEEEELEEEELGEDFSKDPRAMAYLSDAGRVADSIII